MGARLTTAIRICDVAEAVLRKTQTFPDRSPDLDSLALRDKGVEPMLLALSMELALKAWLVFDRDDSEIERTHDLDKLFHMLSMESRARLDAQFKRTVAPRHRSFLHVDHSIGNVLFQHKDAFVHWRYIHEPKSTMFERAVFEATLEMVISEFRTRYRVEPVTERAF